MALPNAITAKLEAVKAEYRVAPHNIDAEQALLGAILVNNDAYYRFELGRNRVGQCHRRNVSRLAPERRISHPDHRLEWLTEA